jgi:hypothetical protein
MVIMVENGASLVDVRSMFNDLKCCTDGYYQIVCSKFDGYGYAIDPKDQWLSDFFAEIDFLSIDLDNAGKTKLYDGESCKMRLETMLNLLESGED